MIALSRDADFDRPLLTSKLSSGRFVCAVGSGRSAAALGASCAPLELVALWWPAFGGLSPTATCLGSFGAERRENAGADGSALQATAAKMRWAVGRVCHPNDYRSE